MSDVIMTVVNFMKTVDDGILTEVGFKLLENDLESDLNILKEGLSQKALCRVCCNLCVVYNLLILFGGYLASTENVPDEIRNLDWRPIALIIEEQLPTYQSHLTDKYAQIFSDVKIQAFKKPIFGDSHRIPVHPNDIPEGVNQTEFYKERGFDV
jgi:hypothetical protein